MRRIITKNGFAPPKMNLTYPFSLISYPTILFEVSKSTHACSGRSVDDQMDYFAFDHFCFFSETKIIVEQHAK